MGALGAASIAASRSHGSGDGSPADTCHLLAQRLGDRLLQRERPPGHFFDTYANGGTLATGKWDIATFGNNYITPDDELTAVLQSDQVPSPTNLGFNLSGINDPVIDSDLALGRSTADADSRDAIYQSLAQHLADTTSVLPMYMIPQVALVNPALGNYMSHPLDIDTWNAADWFVK